MWIKDQYSGLPGPVVDFFNSLHERDFVLEIDYLLQHKDVSAGEGAVKCMFEENFDAVEFQNSPHNPWAYPFPGIRFSFRVSLNDPFEAVIVNDRTFRHYILIACRAFVTEVPNKYQAIADVLKKFGLGLDDPDPDAAEKQKQWVVLKIE